MKKTLLLYIMIFPMLLHAQNLFNQKRTKLKYIKEQIALFEVYGDYLKQGYEIAGDGWSFINDIKHGDFDLRKNYFNSLSSINKNILKYVQEDSVENLQLQILHIQDDLKLFTQNSGSLQLEEKDYINRVMSNLLLQCYEDLDNLTMLTKDSVVQMKDDERLKYIDAIAADIKDKYAFAKHFENSVKMLALSRTKDINDVNALKNLYEIN